jgi:hypothetical protein
MGDARVSDVTNELILEHMKRMHSLQLDMQKDIRGLTDEMRAGSASARQRDAATDSDVMS